MLKGLIFDLDGTLADTATYHVLAWNKMAKKYGISLTQNQQESLRGLSRKQALTKILEDSKHEEQFSQKQQAAMIDCKNQIFVNLVKTMTPNDLLAGVKDLLVAANESRLKIALASNSKNGPLILEYLGIKKYFDAIVDPATLSHPKPSPEIYQKAQELLKLKNNEVVSFDDSVKGIESIKSAGQLAIGIGKKKWKSLPDEVVSSTGELNLDLVNKIYQEHSN